jgi:hypothetical protein
MKTQKHKTCFYSISTTYKNMKTQKHKTKAKKCLVCTCPKRFKKVIDTNLSVGLDEIDGYELHQETLCSLLFTLVCEI